jgi:hypothetical protein
MQTLDFRTVSPSASPRSHAELRLAPLPSRSTRMHAVAASSHVLGMLRKTHIAATSVTYTDRLDNCLKHRHQSLHEIWRFRSIHGFLMHRPIGQSLSC